MSLNDFQITEHFNLSEFQCRCCGQVKIGHDLVFMIEELRKRLGVPVTIVSPYRCPTNNAKVGGAKESYHMQGRACDVTANVDLNTICRVAKQLGFKGIGKYPDEKFVHLDNREVECYWVKYVGKDYRYMNFQQMINI